MSRRSTPGGCGSRGLAPWGWMDVHPGRRPTGGGLPEGGSSTDAVCRSNVDADRRETATHPTPPGGSRAVTGGTTTNTTKTPRITKNTQEDRLGVSVLLGVLVVSRFPRRGGNVPCPITGRDTPEALCRKRDPGAAPQDRRGQPRRTQRGLWPQPKWM